MRDERRTRRYGAAVPTLCLALMAGGLTLGAGTAPVALAQEGLVALDIPAGPLATSLNRLATEMGLQIGFDSDLVRGLDAPGLSGQYTPRQALDALLAGTGIRHAFDGERTVILRGEPLGGEAALGGAIVLEPITVLGGMAPRDAFRTFTSVGVVTAERIDDHNLRDLGQAVNLMGNVRSLPTSAGDARYSIRGLNAEGVTQPSRAAPIIAVNVDGALQGVEAMRRGSRGIWDVEQVEVLRGPQSTVQGRNALGGAIVIKTKDPTYTPELVLDGEIETDDFHSGAIAANLPLVKDQVAFRLAAQYFEGSSDISYADSRVEELGDTEFTELRGKLLLTPEGLPDLRALLTISHTADQPAWNAVTGPDFLEREFDDNTGTAAEFRDTDVNRYIADIEYDLAPGWQLKSVTALVDTDVAIESPQGSTFERADTRDIRDFSQDLRLTYEAPDSPLSGVLGLFAGSFKGDVMSEITTDQLAGFGIPVAAVQELDAENKTTTIAAYGELRYRLLDRWTLIGGGRVLRDEVSSDYRGRALDAGQTEANIIECFILSCVPEAAYGSLDEDSSVDNVVLLPKLGLAFDLTGNQTIAATVSRGYRAGFSEAVAGTTEINDVDPEYLWSYELAYRSRWLENRLEVDANVFYYDYEDQQILTFNPRFPGQTVTENSARSHAYGAELELRYRPVEEVSLFGSLGLLRTEFDKGLTNEGDLSGKEFPQSPTVTATLGGSWRHHSGLFAAADVSYTDDYHSAGDLMNASYRDIDSFTLLNAQVGFEYGRARVALFARNLLDEDYLTSIDADGSLATIGEGRVFGVRGTLRF